MSWWLCKAEDFAQKCAAEQPRMQTSRFGKFAGTLHEPGTPMHWWRPTKAQRTEEE